MDGGDTRRSIGATTERLLPFRSSLAGEETNQSATDKKSINGQGVHWNFDRAKHVTSETADSQYFETDDGENLEEMKEPSTHTVDVSASCKSMQQLRQLKWRCLITQIHVLEVERKDQDPLPGFDSLFHRCRLMTHVGQLQKEQKVVYILHHDGSFVDAME